MIAWIGQYIEGRTANLTSKVTGLTFYLEYEEEEAEAYTKFVAKFQTGGGRFTSPLSQPMSQLYNYAWNNNRFATTGCNAFGYWKVMPFWTE